MVKKTYVFVLLAISIGMARAQKQDHLLSDEIARVSQGSGLVFTGYPHSPVSLPKAHYDSQKKNLPYYQELKQAQSGTGAKMTLADVKTVVLSSEISQKLLSIYKDYITSAFTTEVYSSPYPEGITHFVKIVPFRINSQGLVEELLAYKTEWVISEGGISQQKTSAAFKSSSVLANGDWYKIAVTKTGVYKIDKTFLKNCGIDIDNADPKNIQLYGNGGQMLPESNSAFRYDDLEENAIRFMDVDGDNKFDSEDEFLFYGSGTDEWRFNAAANGFTSLRFTHRLSYYSDTSYYFLTLGSGPGKRIQDNPSLSITPSNTTGSYDYRDYHEKNLVNFIKSGKEFYGEYFDLNSMYSFSYLIPNLVTGEITSAEMKIGARSNSLSDYNFSFSGAVFPVTAAAVNTTDYLGNYVSLASKCATAAVNNSNALDFTVTKLSPGAIAWLDYIVFNSRRYLSFNGAQFSFRDSRTVGSGNITKFSFTTNGAANISIWDVTNPVNVKNQLYTSSGTQLDFVFNHDSLREFIAYNGSDSYSPVFISKVANQNLHAISQADFIIVTHPLFLASAQRLARLHQDEDSLTVSVVTTEQVYNEFSAGKPDPVAIRDFTRMLYKRNLSAGRPVKYLLLFGDASYKVKERYAYGNTAFIPAWQTPNSENPTSSVISDDFFGWMDDNEGTWISDKSLVDVGVGRFTVKTAEEASQAVGKVEAYYKKNYAFTAVSSSSSCDNSAGAFPQGDWRNKVCFVADDEDAAQHMRTADLVANYVKTNYPEFNINKLYSDAYLQYTTPGGQRYPDVSGGLNHEFDKGALIINYTGHGGEVGLGHERYLEVSQIQNLRNINNMPLFVTATCEFSRFDDPDRTSAGELCFLNSNGAAIALFTTVRVAYTHSNEELLQLLYQNMFKPLPNGKMPALGDVARQTKYAGGVNFQYLNFHLLGDPALRLAYPQQRIYTSSVNGHNFVSGVNDTIKALQKVTITGYIGDKGGAKLSGFNGVVYPTVFDKKQIFTCLANDGPGSFNPSTGKPHQFELQKNIIYKGKVQVNNGEFSFTFITPKDISYSFDLGKISYYATNGISDAQGYNQQIVIGGSAGNTYPDNTGPSVGLYLNDKKFVSGGTTNEQPDLYAELADSSGINTVGIGIGHDISAVLDEQSSKPIILNDYYEADLNSYQSGKIKYPFNELPEGNHRLSLKVWDVQNNSSTAYTDFVVAHSAEMALTHVLNYPNPFTSRTQFYFENNQCCLDLKVNIQIFTISGKVVKTISKNVKNEGFRSDAIEWDGKDEFGDKLARGVYIYKISISDSDNKKADKTEKLVILN